eukprot:jgi/Mesvir1/17855/Mv12938-RA.1
MATESKRARVDGAGGISATDKAAFMSVYEKLLASVVGDEKFCEHTEEAKTWLTEMINYNVPGGKLNRGLAVVESFATLQGKHALEEEEYFRAATLGWCIEWLQAFFLVADDIMDHSITRRGQPCWYQLDKVGMIACNDAIILEQHLFFFLRNTFKGMGCYLPLIELFHEATYQTSSGQLLDLITAPVGQAVDLSKYTIATYNKIVKYKTAFYSFYLPVACAMVLAGVTDEGMFESAKRICLQMGEYFQVQDDFLDCYGDPAVIGKIGTDIQDSKCSWLVVQALNKASPEQKEIIKAHYGKSDAEAVAAVKAVYKELQLEEHFRRYEDETYGALVEGIGKEPDEKMQAVFHMFLKKIYKRQK